MKAFVSCLDVNEMYEVMMDLNVLNVLVKKKNVYNEKVDSQFSC